MSGARHGALAGHLAMLAFAALIAGAFSIGARAAPYIGPAALNAVRFALGAAIMAAVARVVTGRSPLSLPEAPWRYLVLGAAMATYFVTMFIALELTTPVAAGAVFTLIPLMSALFGIALLGEWPRAVAWLSLVLAGAGALVVIFRGDLAALLALRIGRGEAIFFFGCVAHALYAPLYKRLSRGEPVALSTFHVLAATTLWITLYGLGEIAATQWLALPAVVWGAILYLAVFTTAGTFVLLQFAVLRLPAAKVLAYGYLTPVIIMAYEAAAGAGWPGRAVVIGGLTTLGGLAVLMMAREKTR